MIKGVFEAVVHHGWGYRYMRVHKFEEGGSVVRGGVVFRWVVISWLAEDDYVSVKLELRIGSVWRVLVRAVVRGSWRQVWRGGGEVVVEVIVEMGSGEGWGVETVALVVYIVMAVHGEGGFVAFCNLCNESDLFVGCVREIEMVKIGGKKKKRMRGRSTGSVI